MYNRNTNILSAIVQSPIAPRSTNVLWDDMISNTLKVYRKGIWTSLGGSGSNGGGGEENISSLGGFNINIKNPVYGNILFLDTTTSNWINKTLSLSDLYDVEFASTTIEDGSLFTYNSDESSWRAIARTSLIESIVNSLGWQFENDELVTDKQVRIKNNLIVEGDTSSGGEGEDTPGYGASSMSQLEDVDLSSLGNNYVLIYDSSSSKWVSKPQSEIVPDLSEYLKIEDANNTFTKSTDFNVLNDKVSILDTKVTLVHEWYNAISPYWYYDSELEAIVCTKNLIVYLDTSSGGEGEDTTVSGTVTGIEINNFPYLPNDQGIIDLSDAFKNIDISDQLTDIKSELNTIKNDVALRALQSSLDTAYEELNGFISDNAEHIVKAEENITNLQTDKADKNIQIIAGTGLTGTGTLESDVTIALDTSGVTAGNYSKVEVDKYGRVTNGFSLTSDDIPSGIDISKISNLQSELDNRYTESEVNNLLNKYVLLEATSQTIKGEIIIEGNLIVTGDTSSGGSGQDTPASGTVTGIKVSSTQTLYPNTAGVIDMVDTLASIDVSDQLTAYAKTADVNSALALKQDTISDLATIRSGAALGATALQSITKSMVDNALGGTASSNANKFLMCTGSTTVWSAIPTKLSQFTDDVVSGKYLPINGGTLGGELKINPSNGAGSFYVFNSDDTYRLTHIWDGNTARLYNITNDGNNYGVLNLQGTIQINGNTAIHAGNIGSYNAGSATKLATARTIWGQSFDGTGNVSGNLYLGTGTIRSSKSGTDRVFIDFGSAGDPYIGYGIASAGIDSHLCGNNIYLHYGTSRTNGLILNSSGNVTIGSSDMTETSYRLYVNGHIYTPNNVYIGSATSYLQGSSTQLWASVSGVSPLVINADSVRRGTSSSAASVTLGTSAYPWGGLYSTTGNFTDAVTMSNELFLGNNMGIYFKNTSGTNVLAMYVSPSNVLQVGYNNVDSVAFQKPVTMSSTLSVASSIIIDGNLLTKGNLILNTSATSSATGGVINFGLYGKQLTSDFSTSFKTSMFGSADNGARFRVARTDVTISNLCAQYGNALAWASNDTNGYLAVNYYSADPGAFIGGGNGEKLNWSAKLFHNKMSLVPNATNSYALGTSSYRWSTIYGTHGNFSASVTATTSVVTPLLQASGGLDIVANGSAAGSRLFLTSNCFRPWDDDSKLIDLGSSSVQWRNLYAVGATFSGDVTINGNLIVKGDTSSGGTAEDTSGNGETMKVFSEALLQTVNGTTKELENGMYSYRITSAVGLNFLNVKPADTNKPCVIHLVKGGSYSLTIPVESTSGCVVTNASGAKSTTPTVIPQYKGVTLVWDTYNKVWNVVYHGLI